MEGMIITYNLRVLDEDGEELNCFELANVDTEVEGTAAEDKIFDGYMGGVRLLTKPLSDELQAMFYILSHYSYFPIPFGKTVYMKNFLFQNRGSFCSITKDFL